MDRRSVLRVTRYVNKGTLRLLAAVGMVTAGCIAAAAPDDDPENPETQE